MLHFILGTTIGPNPYDLKSDVERPIEEEVRSDSSIVHNNQPILMEVFRDNVTEKDKVIVVASILGGTTETEFTLLDSGPGTTQAQK
jgi:tryptophan synthase beta subunit